MARKTHEDEASLGATCEVSRYLTDVPPPSHVYQPSHVLPLDTSRVTSLLPHAPSVCRCVRSLNRSVRARRRLTLRAYNEVRYLKAFVASGSRVETTLSQQGCLADAPRLSSCEQATASWSGSGRSLALRLRAARLATAPGSSGRCWR